MSDFFDLMFRVDIAPRYGDNSRSLLRDLYVMIEDNPRIVDAPATPWDGRPLKATPLLYAVMHIDDFKIIRVLLEEGARNFYIESEEPTLIQAIQLFVGERKWLGNKIISVIRLVLNTLSPAELRQRSTTGQSPYMVAVINNLPEDLIEEIRIATDGKNTNKNVYGRTVAAYRNLKTHVMASSPNSEPTSGGTRRKSRRRRLSTRRRR